MIKTVFRQFLGCFVLPCFDWGPKSKSENISMPFNVSITNDRVKEKYTNIKNIKKSQKSHRVFSLSICLLINCHHLCSVYAQKSRNLRIYYILNQIQEKLAKFNFIWFLANLQNNQKKIQHFVLISLWTTRVNISKYTSRASKKTKQTWIYSKLSSGQTENSSKIQLMVSANN